MATATLLSVSEYLATVYHPDRDFLDGVLQERNMGEQPHARIQMILGRIFDVHRSAWNTRVLSEQRVQISPERFRIPDLCILRRSDPKDLIIRFAPLLCIEILSREDSLGELQDRVDDYTLLGVAHIWAVDPWHRRGWHCSPRGFDQPADATLRIPETPIAIHLPELWRELDED